MSKKAKKLENFIKSDDAFNNMLDADPEIDYTGAKADHYIQKYVNRPEDMGTMEGLHNSLAGMGFVNPLADALNASIYLLEGDYVNAGIAGAAILPMGTIFAKGVKGRKVISESLTQGTDYWSKYNKQLNDLGQNSKYINEKTILDGNFIVSHTNKAVKDGQRAAVIVKIKNTSTGNIIFQPFYRSTGTGHSARSQYNWLPFEGVMTSQGSSISVKTARNQSRKFWSPDESVVGWQGKITEGTGSGGLRFKEGLVKPGWYIKAFKNYQGDLVDSSVGGKIKRGVKAHETIDHYLRNMLNFDVIPKKLSNISSSRAGLGIKPKVDLKKLPDPFPSPKKWDDLSITEKIKRLSEDIEGNKGVSKRLQDIYKENIKKYNPK